MNFLNFFNKNTETGDSTSIGQFECASENLANAVSSLLDRMGMANPSSLTAHSAKGVKITTKGNKYLITFYMFNPPLEIEWTDMDDMEKLQEYLEKIVDTDKKIGYINFRNIGKGLVNFQLGISK